MYPRRPAVMAATILACAGLAACAPGGSSADTSANNQTQTVVTDPAKIGRTTITVLDSFTDSTSPIAKWMETVDAAFMKKYPQITVTRKSQNSNDINSTLRLRLADKSAPDIVPANQGWSGVGALSASGLLLNLDAYATAYHWTDRLPHTIAQQHMASSDGKRIGVGSLFGMPINQGAFIEVFYNRALMTKLGLKPPATLAEFQQQLAAAKSAGIVPIQLGAQDQSATPTLLALQDALGDIATINGLVYGTGQTPIAQSGMVPAADTFRRWVQQGYVPANYAGATSGDASDKFVNGSGLFYVYYSGFLPFKDQAQADRFGAFVMPRDDGKPVTATGSSTQNFSVAKNSHSPDAAAAYLDFLSSPAAGQISMDTGIIPILGQWQATSRSALLDDGIGILNQINRNDGYVPYFDWSTPTMLDTLNQQLALLLAGKIDGNSYAQAAQANLDAFLAKK